MVTFLANGLGTTQTLQAAALTAAKCGPQMAEDGEDRQGFAHTLSGSAKLQFLPAMRAKIRHRTATDVDYRTIRIPSQSAQNESQATLLHRHRKQVRPDCCE